MNEEVTPLRRAELEASTVAMQRVDARIAARRQAQKEYREKYGLDLEEDEPEERSVWPERSKKFDLTDVV